MPSKMNRLIKTAKTKAEANGHVMSNFQKISGQIVEIAFGKCSSCGKGCLASYRIENGIPEEIEGSALDLNCN